jgi:glucosylglycerate hydrolase
LRATVIWHIYEKLKKSGPEKARLLLEEFYPKLYNLHKYFYTARDPEGWGLITIYHPWESGFDNSPRWDETLSKIAPKDIPDYKRLDTKYVNSKFRPNDEEYDKYVYLALELKKNKYDDKLIYSEHQFKIKDKVCSSILYLSNKRLRQMAEILGEDNSEINEWIRRFEKNLMLKLWNENDNLFYDYDLISEKPIKIRTVGALMPLMTGLLSEKQIDDMTMHLDKANFCGSASCAVSLIPSAGVEDQTFNHEQYWRGPIWINVNWFLLKGFEEYGMKERAEHLRTHILKLVIDNGFWEYYSPIDGHGLGAESFSWTAALAIDLLQQ